MRVTDGIDAQARVLVTVENKDTETIFNAAGIDFDVLKAQLLPTSMLILLFKKRIPER